MNDRVDQARCPLCGGPNGCGLTAGQSKCWCFFVEVRKDVLAQLPEELRDKACLCRACATGKASPARVHEQLQGLLRKR